MKKEWAPPSLEVLDVSMTMVLVEPPPGHDDPRIDPFGS
ncbi:paeninodin family lasso peptide [Paenibacillus foliorum]|nr:paeninodin family lasso peptide [Paenibacillus foliorum]